MAYQPRLGSLAEEAIVFLRHHKGRISTTDLADFLGCRPASMTASLVTAVNHGVVRREREGHRMYWCIARSGGFDPCEFVASLNSTMHGERFDGVDIDAVHRKSKVPHHPV